MAISKGVDATIAPIPPADINRPIKSGSLSLGNQTAKALNAPIKAPETPSPINPRAITSDQTLFPKLNKKF